MRRRQLLTGGLCAVALLALRRIGVAGEAPRPLRKAINLGMVAGDLPLREKLERLRRAGFDGVEVNRPSSLDRGELREACQAAGVTLHGVVDSAHWKQTLSDPDPEVRARGRQALEEALDDAAYLGATTVLLVPAVVGAGVSYAEAYTRSQAEIRRVLPRAAELGVKIAIENVWNHFLLSPLEAARYVDELESPQVGWYLDVGNVVNIGWPDQWVRILGKRILKVHVKEYSRRKRDEEGLWKGFQVPLLEGDCDWPKVMAALDEVGYAGWLTAEVGGGDEARLREIASRMDRILAS